MEVIRARQIGPCFGVRDALATVEAVLDRASDGRQVTALGHIVHNPQAMERLAARGLAVDPDPSGPQPGGQLVITAHGAPPATFEAARSRGLEVVDTTCPLVRRVQDAGRQVAGDGRLLVVVGHGNHPEVRGVVGWAGGGVVVRDAADVASVPSGEHVGVVVQSTFPASALPPILAALEERAASVEVHDTRCPVVTLRQRAAGELAERVDVIVVVGGRGSANTNALVEHCAARRPTHHVETADEVEASWFEPGQKVGITSGTSTPDWLVDAVENVCRSF
ncbi:MAG TPA: 4-hydroxy-3-methylbut-2-enyl diphosphate reductase [Candidatus Angelobacter sp.]|nr:4-hydroxy-3-methylbut-2-enyl diphosphate reductase [Candidatus Angelobacter sp.]